MGAFKGVSDSPSPMVRQVEEGSRDREFHAFPGAALQARGQETI